MTSNKSKTQTKYTTITGNKHIDRYNKFWQDRIYYKKTLLGGKWTCLFAYGIVYLADNKAKLQFKELNVSQWIIEVSIKYRHDALVFDDGLINCKGEKNTTGNIIAECGASERYENDEGFHDDYVSIRTLKIKDTYEKNNIMYDRRKKYEKQRRERLN